MSSRPVKENFRSDFDYSGGWIPHKMPPKEQQQAAAGKGQATPPASKSSGSFHQPQDGKPNTQSGKTKDADQKQATGATPKSHASSSEVAKTDLLDMVKDARDSMNRVNDVLHATHEVNESIKKLSDNQKASIP